MSTYETTPSSTKFSWGLPALTLAVAVAWYLLYSRLQIIADWLTYTLPSLTHGTHLAESINFFLYDVPKILMLLAGMIFVVTVIRSFFSPEQTRALLGGKQEGLGNILVAAPMVNEVALAMLFGMFGWKIAGLYLSTGLVVAIISGVTIGRLKMERHLEDFVWQIKVGQTGSGLVYKPNWDDRLRDAAHATRDIVGRVWLFVVIGIAVGAGIHGYVPEDFLINIPKCLFCVECSNPA